MALASLHLGGVSDQALHFSDKHAGLLMSAFALFYKQVRLLASRDVVNLALNGL